MSGPPMAYLKPRTLLTHTHTYTVKVMYELVMYYSIDTLDRAVIYVSSRPKQSE